METRELLKDSCYKILKPIFKDMVEGRKEKSIKVLNGFIKHVNKVMTDSRIENQMNLSLEKFSLETGIPNNFFSSEDVRNIVFVNSYKNTKNF